MFNKERRVFTSLCNSIRVFALKIPVTAFSYIVIKYPGLISSRHFHLKLLFLYLNEACEGKIIPYDG